MPGLRKRQTRSRRKLVKYPHLSENVGGQGRRKWSRHRRRTQRVWFRGGQRCEAVMGFRTASTIGISGPHRKGGGWASWASGLSPDIPSLVTITTSDIRSASGAFLVTGGFHSHFVGRCCLCAVPDSVRRRNTGRHSSGTTFAHYRVA